MSCQARGAGISVVVHALFLSLLFTFTAHRPAEKKVISLDFSILNTPTPSAPSGPTPEPKQKPAKQVKKAPKPVARKQVKAVPAVKKEIFPEPVPTEEELKPMEEAPLHEEPPAVIGDTVEEPILSTDVAKDTEVVSEEAHKTPATSTVSESPQERYTREHFLYIKEAIRKNLLYPPFARRRGWEGKVVLSFVVCEDGSLADIRVIESSGFPILDKNAIATVRKLSPLPRPPLRAELVIPISYRLG